MNKDVIFSEIDLIFNEIVEIRRIIHQKPELSFKEFKTTDLICNFLDTLGVEYERLIETGVVGLIGKKQSDKCICFRADIDALPIQEETGLPFASKSPNIMHACGHDIHTSILLGTIKVLKKFEDLLPINVKFIFQPGEEKLPGGAKKLIEKGVLSNPNVIAIFGQHTYPETEVGTISIASGTIMASADELYWTLSGKSSHAAQPHLGSDPIRAGISIISSLYDLPSKFKQPLEPALLAITSINGGSATNIFPNEVKIMGTLRTFNQSTRSILLEKIQEFSTKIASCYGVYSSFEPVIGYPPLVNDTKLTEFVKNQAKEILGDKQVLDFEPKMWAEDFSYYLQKVPGVFWFLGVKPKGSDGEFFGLHSSKYNPDEEAMKFGIALFVKLAFSFSCSDEF